MKNAMQHLDNHDFETRRLDIQGVSDYDAWGYDAAPRVGEYAYKMTQRPYSIGCQPKSGMVRYEECNSKSDTGYYGILYYNRELSIDEVDRFELTEA